MARVDELQAELEVAKLEEKLAKAKGTKNGPERELKLELRAARQRFRETVGREPVGEGDAVAKPDVIKGIARANEAGG